MYDKPLPPGHKKYQFGSSNELFFILPSLAAAKLAAEKYKELDQDEEEDNDVFRSEIKRLINTLLLRDNLTTQQLYKAFTTFHEQQKIDPQATGFRLKEAHDQFIKIFDMKAINKQKNDTSMTRSMQFILKRFNSEDDGQRLLKEVPKNFITALQKLKIQYPNCVQFIDYIEAFATLALKQTYPIFYFPPVLLLGPPGIGKTAVVLAISELLGITSRQVDLASTTAGFVIGGSSSQWSDAKTGVVIDMLRDEKAANPILILDELDKVSGDAKHDPLGPLYSLLEQKTAAKFIDEALNLPANASHVLYVATANFIEAIPAPILSRFTVIEIHEMTPEQHGQVTQSIYNSLLQQHACAALFTARLSTPVIDALRPHSPRIIKATLRRALAQSAMRESKTKRLCITTKDLLFSSTDASKDRAYNHHQPFGFLN